METNIKFTKFRDVIPRTAFTGIWLDPTHWHVRIKVPSLTPTGKGTVSLEINFIC